MGKDLTIFMSFAILCFVLIIWAGQSFINEQRNHEKQCADKGGKSLYLKYQGFICVKNENFIEVK